MEYPLVSIQHISKVYESGDMKTEVLKDLSFEINKGEFVAIMGHSGSGKSTLMHTLGILDRPSSGVYLLEGEKINDLTDNQLAELRNKKMGFVFQSFNLLPRTSTVENVELPLIYSNISTYKRRKLSEQALIQVGLGHRLTHAPNQLSGGEQQRVAIARALVGDPDIIFADEPTGNLDTKNSLEIMEVLAQLNRKGKTIILVTHEDTIASFANRIIRLQDGRIISDQLTKQI